MASVSKCPYCGGQVRSDQLKCPGCGGANENYVPAAPSRSALRPKTIRELQEYCASRKLPLKQMRFFIGENYRPPKAFGIYRDGENFIVYKNKGDGSRFIRYSGPDEAKAVDELFNKLLYECHAQGMEL